MQKITLCMGSLCAIISIHGMDVKILRPIENRTINSNAVFIQKFSKENGLNKEVLLQINEEYEQLNATTTMICPTEICIKHKTSNRFSPNGRYQIKNKSYITEIYDHATGQTSSHTKTENEKYLAISNNKKIAYFDAAKKILHIISMDNSESDIPQKADLEREPSLITFGHLGALLAINIENNTNQKCHPQVALWDIANDKIIGFNFTKHPPLTNNMMFSDNDSYLFFSQHEAHIITTIETATGNIPFIFQRKTPIIHFCTGIDHKGEEIIAAISNKEPEERDLNQKINEPHSLNTNERSLSVWRISLLFPHQIGIRIKNLYKLMETQFAHQ